MNPELGGDDLPLALIQGFVDRRFYRQKYEARQTLEAFSIKLREETDLDGLSVELLAVARHDAAGARLAVAEADV